MRKQWLALTVSTVLLIVCAACTPTKTPAVQLPNPVKEAAGSADFEVLKLYIEAPEGASNVSYSTISDQIAQIRFTWNVQDYTYRTARTAEDIAGVYETFDEEETAVSVDYATGGVTVRIRTVGAGKAGALATWEQGEVRYSLYTPHAVTPEEMQALALVLVPQSLPEPQPPEEERKCGRADVTVLENGVPVATRAISDAKELDIVDAIAFDSLVKSMAVEGIEVSELESCVRLSLDWADGAPGETYYAFDADGRHVLQRGETGWYNAMGDDAYAKLQTLLAGAEPLRAAADRAISFLAAGDFPALSGMVSETCGLSFTPYSTVNPETDRNVSADALAAFPEDTAVQTWGVYDGSGEPIQLTNADYWARFVWNADYRTAPNVTENAIRMTGTAYDNALSVYPGAALVDYHFDGLDPQYEGIDWCSLSLVLLPENGVWRLMGLIHSEMTL